MPLFFIISGYLFKYRYIYEKWTFVKKRLKSLYLPFIKYNIVFILLHNLFLNIHLIKGYDYDFVEIVKRLLFAALCMRNSETLLGGFWFLQVLFISSMMILLIISFTKNKHACALFLLGVTIFVSYLNTIYPIPSVFVKICYAIVFLFIGISLKDYSKCFENKKLIIPSLIIVLLHSVFCFSSFDNSIWYFVPFFIISGLAGTIMTLNISNSLAGNVKRFFCYAGDNSLTVLALHLISFKFCSLLLIIINNYPVDYLEKTPTITGVAHAYLLYSIFGVCIPLIITFICSKLTTKKDKVIDIAIR